MPDKCRTTVFILTPLIFCYHLPLNSKFCIFIWFKLTASPSWHGPSIILLKKGYLVCYILFLKSQLHFPRTVLYLLTDYFYILFSISPLSLFLIKIINPYNIYHSVSGLLTNFYYENCFKKILQELSIEELGFDLRDEVPAEMSPEDEKDVSKVI